MTCRNDLLWNRIGIEKENKQQNCMKLIVFFIAITRASHYKYDWVKCWMGVNWRILCLKTTREQNNNSHYNKTLNDLDDFCHNVFKPIFIVAVQLNWWMASIFFLGHITRSTFQTFSDGEHFYHDNNRKIKKKLEIKLATLSATRNIAVMKKKIAHIFNIFQCCNLKASILNKWDIKMIVWLGYMRKMPTKYKWFMAIYEPTIFSNILN